MLLSSIAKLKIAGGPFFFQLVTEFKERPSRLGALFLSLMVEDSEFGCCDAVEVSLYFRGHNIEEVTHVDSHSGPSRR